MRPKCRVRRTLSLWRTKKEDRKGRREEKGFRDECLLRSLSVAMREVARHGTALGFDIFMEAKGKQNPKTGDTKTVV